MAQAVAVPTPSSSHREYRALDLHRAPPRGCVPFAVLTQRHAPHLRYGEIALVDLNDHRPVSGELFVIQWSNGERAITQLVCKRGSWFTGDFGPSSPFGRVLDGPRSEEHMRGALIGRIVGILNSLPVQAA